VDHTGADVADAFRRPLHALGAGLRAAAGMAPGRFRSLGDESRQREREQQERKAEQGESVRDDMRRTAALEAQQADRAARREDAAQRTASLDDYRQQMAAIRERESQGLISQRQAVADLSRMRAQMMRDTRDPESAISASAREAFEAEVALMPERLRSQLGPLRLEGRTAEEIGFFRDRLRQVGILRNTGRRGGGGGGSASQARPEGYSEAQWRQMTRSQRGAAIRDSVQEQAEGGGVLIAPGVRSSLDLRESDAADIRRGLTSAASSAANIRGLGSIADDFGGVSARVSPEARARITPRLTIARGMVAQLGETGVINATEVPTINAALPTRLT
jgi:hypothetical protein